LDRLSIEEDTGVRDTLRMDKARDHEGRRQRPRYVSQVPLTRDGTVVARYENHVIRNGGTLTWESITWVAIVRVSARDPIVTGFGESQI